MRIDGRSCSTQGPSENAPFGNRTKSPGTAGVYKVEYIAVLRRTSPTVASATVRKEESVEGREPRNSSRRMRHESHGG